MNDVLDGSGRRVLCGDGQVLLHVLTHAIPMPRRCGLTKEDTMSSQLQSLGTPAAEPQHPLTPYLGRYVIVRSSASGVHAGILAAVQGTGDTFTATLSESRRLWRWWAKEGVGLDGVAECGLADRAEVRTSVQCSAPKVVAGCCEALVCSAAGEASIRASKAARS